MFGNPHYPTYQVFLCVGIAALITGILMPYFIKFLKRGGIGQQIRADGPQTHLVKQGTPTMGGVVLLVGAMLTLLLGAPWVPQLIISVVVILATASLGLLDDIESVAHKRSLGLTPSQKMAGLVIISVGFCLAAVNICGVTPDIAFPGGFKLDLGVMTTTLQMAGATIRIPWLYVIFVFLLVAGMSNAVNLTDGLDGLAAGSIIIVMGALAAIAFLADQLSLAMLAGAIGGACIGFLWYNCYPAEIFMGDTGSLALGAAIGVLGVLTKTEVISLVMGGLFIVEALSVMIQVVSFKATGKRVFLMAPIHHHFEKKGWSETKVVIRFWIISATFALLGFALYFQIH